ncbi:MAG: MFS transporter [Deltaproteobacteria bacterium]|nr:MFS transporter [Deltaproteobacteria bacterium]
MSGIAMAGAPVGNAFAPPLATILIGRYGWSISYIVIGCLALLITSVAAGCLHHSGKEQLLEDERPALAANRAKRNLSKLSAQPETRVPEKEISLQEAVRSWPFWCLGLILFSAYFSQQDMLVHIVPHATNVGISPTNAALILTAITVTNIFGNFGGGSIIWLSSSLSACLFLAWS